MPTAARSIRCGQQPQPRSRQRPSAGLYNHAWQKARLHFLARNPLCVACQAEDKLTPATVVDHHVPHRGDVVKFWDVSNWRALCATHHNQKTGRGE